MGVYYHIIVSIFLKNEDKLNIKSLGGNGHHI